MGGMITGAQLMVVSLVQAVLNKFCFVVCKGGCQGRHATPLGKAKQSKGSVNHTVEGSASRTALLLVGEIAVCKWSAMPLNVTG